MKKVNLLSKAEMRKVMGGVAQADVCKDMTGADLSACQYNVCMSGWDFSSNTEQANNNKLDSCCALIGAC